MAEAIKDIYSIPFFQRFSQDLQLVVDGVQPEYFITHVMDEAWEDLAYKQRTRLIAQVLHRVLPGDYPQAIAKLLNLLDLIKDRFPDFSLIDDKNFQLLALEYGAVLDSYVEQYGLDDYETSVRAIEKITQFTSCEFCVRPFIMRYPEQMMQQMLDWAQHPHWAVRRLASEGCRPRLPWGMALSPLKADPAPILPILVQLKTDPSRFVRLSVANNLNDIAKDNPQIVLQLAQQWYGESPEVDWLLKHGCRTLLKQGNPELMALFGFDTELQDLQVTALEIASLQVRVGEALEFQFALMNHRDAARKIRLEYAIYYQKAKGNLAKKVHKISEKVYLGNTRTEINRKHAFRVVTTRQLHLGLHQVSLIINGQEFERYDFELIAP